MTMKDKKAEESNPHWSRIVCKSLYAIDLSCSRKLALCSGSETFRPVMKFLEISCHGIPWFCGVLLGLYQSTTITEKEFFLNLFIALVIDLMVIILLKIIFRRSRPAYNKSDMFFTVSVDGYSFPSGHATRAVMLSAFMFHHIKSGLVVKALIMAWAFCVGTSRVVLGRHHVSDVIVGFVVGYLQYYWLIQTLWLNWLDFDNYVLSIISES